MSSIHKRVLMGNNSRLISLNNPDSLILCRRADKEIPQAFCEKACLYSISIIIDGVPKAFCLADEEINEPK